MSLLAPNFNTGSYAVLRPIVAGSIDAYGQYVPPATFATITIQASVQALSGRSLRDLPEGRRADDYREVFTNSPLYTVQPATSMVPQLDEPDVITINGESYRVIKVKYHGVISGHFRATAERIAIP